MRGERLGFDHEIKPHAIGSGTRLAAADDVDRAQRPARQRRGPDFDGRYPRQGRHTPGLKFDDRSLRPAGGRQFDWN